MAGGKKKKKKKKLQHYRFIVSYVWDSPQARMIPGLMSGNQTFFLGHENIQVRGKRGTMR